VIISSLEDIVKFGYKENKKVKKFKPSLNFWLPTGTK
jgi:ribosomal protein L32E